MASFKWEVDESQFLTKQEARKLRRILKKAAEEALKKDNTVAVRDWMVIDTALATGLRVEELSDLRCGDLFIEGGRSTVFVRYGKGNKPGWVRFGNFFREHVIEYLQWKTDHGESISKDAPFFASSITKKHLTKRALQYACERSFRKAGIRNDLSIHSLRHTYAAILYKKSGYNLRLVQKQLRHSSIKTTEVYAHVVDPDLDRAVEKLFD